MNDDEVLARAVSALFCELTGFTPSPAICLAFVARAKAEAATQGTRLVFEWHGADD